MTGPAWARVKEVCLAALDLPPDERSEFLEQACGDDRALRAEVESLLAEHDPDFLETPIVSLSGLAPDGAEGDPPERIGAFRIVRPLGRGGMGEVLLAVQEGEGFERPVALKLIRPGMATDDVLERFRLERKILAGLDHPNLARLIDGGATGDGRPYFVMEFVEGAPITEYCDAKGLSIGERLELFTAVCDAVHHAHQSLVVHRDIKPGNILVTPDGQPKLLDFGIGKVLDPSAEGASERTAMTRRVLTPEYAAPEQVRGDAITTATDVHGLGLLLYELLTGRHPFAASRTTPAELDRAVLTTAPSAPSAVVADPARERDGEALPSPSEIARLRGTVPRRLRRQLRGDLDNIVLKALRKEPERRYASVEALRADVERHLAGQPVAARPDSLGYRLSKLAARNPWGVAAAALAAVAIGVSVVVPWQQNRRLTEERDKALAVQGFLLEAFGTTSSDEAISARELLDLQAGRVDELYADEPELRAQMHVVLAEAYDKLGLYPEALASAERAVEVHRALGSAAGPELATALNAFGWALYRVGRRGEGIAPLREAVAIRRALGRDARRELGRSLNDLGVVLAETGDPEGALALHREALEIRRSVLGDTDLATGISANNVSTALYALGDLAGAAREAELALELLEQSVGPDHQRTMVVRNNLAAMRVAAGDHLGAEAAYRDLLERQTRLQGAAHPLTNRVRNGLATTLVQLERREEAEALLEETLGVARGQGEAGLDREAAAADALATLLLDAGRVEEAAALLDASVARFERLRAPDAVPAGLLAARRRARIGVGDPAGAASDQERWLAASAAGLEDRGALDALAVGRVLLAELRLRAGRPDAAAAALAGLEALLEDERVSDETRRRHRAVADAVAAAGSAPEASAGAPARTPRPPSPRARP